MDTKRKAAWAVLQVLLFLPLGLAAQDHPLVKPYEGSKQERRDEKAFDEVELTVGVEKGKQKNQTFEGKITKISYWNPKNRSELEVFRNYSEALKAAGFQTLFSCKENAKDTGGCAGHVKSILWPACNSGECRYLFSQLGGPERDVYVALGVDHQSAGIVIVEVEPMERGKVRVDAAALAGDINRTGHVAVYGIYFDTGKADIKPDSDAVLAEIAKLLKENAALKLHVVGHTDNVGALAMNMDLSKRRAAAVMQALVTKHGIAAARLHAEGVGPLAPVAPNTSDDGRAKNRRVELVEQ